MKRPEFIIRFFRDGSHWCAVDHVGFINLQESPAGFGSTPARALIDLLQEKKRAQKVAVQTFLVKVRDAGYQGYVATCAGKSASCTANRETAVRRVAEKLLPGQPVCIRRIGTNAWTVSRKEESDET